MYIIRTGTQHNIAGRGQSSVRVEGAKSRGTEGAEGLGYGEGDTIPSRVGVWGGAVPLSRNFFEFFCLAMVHFDAYWALVLMLV